MTNVIFPMKSLERFKMQAKTRFCVVGVAIALGIVLSSSLTNVYAQTGFVGDELSFGRDVRPIISNHCFVCHGPDEQNREAEVRLDIAHEVDLDEVLARITSKDPDFMMPPPKLNKPLHPEQIRNLTRWIEQGAPYKQHWAFSAPENHELPKPEFVSWSKQPIDLFVLEGLENRKLRPSPRADRRTLVRRVTLDLTGLPPTLEQIEAFLGDTSESAFENLVDRLLGSPAYGEHMARYWLDLVRFADTNGLHHDHYREMTPYRDWVIRSFNDNMPMDDFITFQLAGDLFDRPTVDQKIASGFNRLHLIIDRGTALPEESFFRNVVDQVSAVGTAFMGLSMQCAVCHDHKYDPITQKDFYQLSAFFNNFDGEPETGGRGGTDFKRGLQPPYINLPSKQQEENLIRLNAEITELELKIKELQARQAAAKDEKAKTDNTETSKDETLQEKQSEEKQSEENIDTLLTEELKALTAKLKTQKNARDTLMVAIPATLVMKERSGVRPTHVMIRGAYTQPGDEVSRDVPGFLPPMKKQEGTKTRMDLAEWFVDPSNPLTARVAVNRFWQQFFGVGLVKTSEDFGSQGESPSHPELLDYLAIRFVNTGWDVKAIVRSIVLSQTYQQTSTATRDQYVSDPENRQLARGSRLRLEAEVVRDQLLATSGLLNARMFGKSVKPPQPEGLWKIVAMPGSYPRIYKSDSGENIYRRSVYTFWKRGLPPPQMTIFDAPTRESCIARRERTNTPLQALLLMNEEQHFAAAMHFAKALLRRSELSDEQRIVIAYETITSQLPNEQRTRHLHSARQEFLELYANHPEAAQEMVAASKDSDIADISVAEHQAELASWTMLVHSLLNLDITKTRE